MGFSKDQWQPDNCRHHGQPGDDSGEILQLNNAPGNVTNFNSANAYTWRILSTTSASPASTAALSRSTRPTSPTRWAAARSCWISRRMAGTCGPLCPDVAKSRHWPAGLDFPRPTYITGNENSILSPDDPASGAVQTIAVHPTNPKIARLGAVNGGFG